MCCWLCLIAGLDCGLDHALDWTAGLDVWTFYQPVWDMTSAFCMAQFFGKVAFVSTFGALVRICYSQTVL